MNADIGYSDEFSAGYADAMADLPASEISDGYLDGYNAGMKAVTDTTVEEPEYTAAGMIDSETPF